MSNAIIGSIVDVYGEGSPTFRGCVTGKSDNGQLYEVVNLECGMVGDYPDYEVSDYLIRNINKLDK